MADVNSKKEKPCSGKAATPRCGTLQQMVERRNPRRKPEEMGQPKPIEVMDRIVRRKMH